MRLLLIGLAACSTVDAAAPAPALLERRVLFADNDQLRLPCWTSRPHLPTIRVGDLRCSVTATEHVRTSVRAARLECIDVPATIPSLARPMPDGWFVVERDVGAWHLGYGRDRDRPVMPEFGWQRETQLSIALEWLHKDGADFPEQPAPRRWDAWANDDYMKLRRTLANGTGWCTQTTVEGVGGLPTRHEVCWKEGVITGASVAIFQGWLADPRCEKRPTTDPLCDRLDDREIVDEPERHHGWTMQTRCGDAPFLYPW